MFENRKVIITLTTIPSRFKNIMDVLPSLMNQSIKADEIVLSLPVESVREPSSKDPYDAKLIKQVESLGITVLRVKKDYGPATKLLGCLQRELDANHSPETEPLILTFDDDKNYHADCAKQLLEGWQRNQDCVVARKGSVIMQLSKDSRLYLANKAMYDTIDRHHEITLLGCNLSKDTEISIVFGTGGVLYRPSFFDYDVFDFRIKRGDKPIKHMFFVDDVFLSGYLGFKGVTKKAISFEKTDFLNKLNGKNATLLDVSTKNREINPLIDINGKSAKLAATDVCIQYFKKYIVKSKN